MLIKIFSRSDLREFGETDKAGIWYPSAEVAEYFYYIRAPSPEWPNTYADAAQTTNFANWCAENRPEFAYRLGIVEDD